MSVLSNSTYPEYTDCELLKAIRADDQRPFAVLVKNRVPNHLQDKSRSIYLLTQEGHSIKEVAALLNASEKGIQYLLTPSRKKLRLRQTPHIEWWNDTRTSVPNRHGIAGNIVEWVASGYYNTEQKYLCRMSDKSDTRQN